MLLVKLCFDVPSTPSGVLTLLRLTSSVMFVMVYLLLIRFI